MVLSFWTTLSLGMFEAPFRQAIRDHDSEFRVAGLDGLGFSGPGEDLRAFALAL